MKSYMNRLPSEIEYQKLIQSHQILEDQLKQSNQTIFEYRKEKNLLKKQLVTHQSVISEQQQKIKSHELSLDKSMLNAKCLTIDERLETEKKFKEFNEIIKQLNEKLNQETLDRKHEQHINENNLQTVQSLTSDITKKEQIIKEMKNQLRQVHQLENCRMF